MQTAKAPYVGRYIVEQIREIPAGEVAESHAGAYPTVLVIGPRPFITQAYDEIAGVYPQTELRVSQQTEIDPLDGYLRLLEDPRSRLGWRILIAVFPTDDGDRAIVEAHRDDIDIVDLLPPERVEGHLTVVSLLSRIRDGEELDNGDAQLLANQTGPVVGELASLLGAGDGDEGDTGAGGHEREPEAPTIVCTSLVGAKGLSAGHVFVVGLNDGHFPRDAGGITDDEVCQFLVALSRTRGRCHLISAGRLGAQPLARSRFLGWVSAYPSRRTVNADYFK